MAERMVEANGVELCTEPFGNPADPPILLINGQQVHGGPGNDLVIGGEKDSQDFLSGHQGDDILKGLGGNDQLDTFATHSGKDKDYGGGGDDVLIADDGEPDLVNAAGGSDFCDVDSSDQVKKCEDKA